MKNKKSFFDFIQNKSNQLKKSSIVFNKRDSSNIIDNLSQKDSTLQNVCQKEKQEENFELFERVISTIEENKLRKALSNSIIFNELTEELL